MSEDLRDFYDNPLDYWEYRDKSRARELRGRWKKIEEGAIEADENTCPHERTVLLNEEGHSGKYCADCGKKLEEEDD